MHPCTKRQQNKLDLGGGVVAPDEHITDGELVAEHTEAIEQAREKHPVSLAVELE